MESVELQINGLVVMCSRFVGHEFSNCETLLLLDIWPVGGNKVLSVSFPPFNVISFKPGDWMDVVLALADRISSAGAIENRQRVHQQVRSGPSGVENLEPRLDLRPAPKEIWHLVVPRQDVETGDVSAILSYLKSLSSSASSAWKMRGRISISFDGYSRDLRSIFTVPAVRRFLAKIHAAWPYWFFFLNQVDHSIKIVAACLCDLQRVEPASWKLSQVDLMHFVGVGMTALGDLGRRYQFEESEMDAIATGVFQYLQAELG